MSKAHAEHNAALCEKLNREGGFNDWVVTTAFYAALHFVHSKLFGKPGESFHTYFNSLGPSKSNKHRETINLVYSRTKFGAEYEHLHDMSHTARYRNYQISKTMVDASTRNLSIIKANCV